MARYIDADKFKNHLEKAMEKKHLIHGVKGVDVGAVIKALEMQPTADVVPKSEVEKMVQDVTRLEQEIETLKDNNEHLAVMLEEAKVELEAMRGAANSYKMHYENIAREIFEEIENALSNNFHADCQMGDCIEDYYDESLRDDIAELKKKYTEEQNK